MIKQVPKLIHLRESNQLMLIVEDENYTLEFYDNDIDPKNKTKT